MENVSYKATYYRSFTLKLKNQRVTWAAMQKNKLYHINIDTRATTSQRGSVSSSFTVKIVELSTYIKVANTEHHNHSLINRLTFIAFVVLALRVFAAEKV